MKISYISDVHTEFLERRRKEELEKLPNYGGDVMIIAGDLGYFQGNEYNEKALEYIRDFLCIKYKWVIIVPGNHEYYGGNYDKILQGSTRVKGTDNAYVIKDAGTTINNVTFYCTTLIPDLTKVKSGAHVWRLNDFNSIHKGDKLITPKDYTEIHKNSIKLLKEFIEDADYSHTNILVSHFSPIYKEVANQNKNHIYYGDELDPYFYNEVRDDGIDFSKIPYWIYGHNHYNPKDDIKVGNTVFTCNQVGYVHEPKTWTEKYIEVE